MPTIQTGILLFETYNKDGTGKLVGHAIIDCDISEKTWKEVLSEELDSITERHKVDMVIIKNFIRVNF